MKTKMKTKMSLLTAAAMMLFQNTSQASGTLTKDEKIQACYLISEIVPREFKQPLDIRVCLRQFTFEVIEARGAIKVVEMIGQTVEDMATMCTLSIVAYGREVSVPAPECELH